jgi:hypothetical protein
MFKPKNLQEALDQLEDAEVNFFFKPGLHWFWMGNQAGNIALNYFVYF